MGHARTMASGGATQVYRTCPQQRRKTTQAHSMRQPNTHKHARTHPAYNRHARTHARRTDPSSRSNSMLPGNTNNCCVLSSNSMRYVPPFDIPFVSLNKNAPTQRRTDARTHKTQQATQHNTRVCVCVSDATPINIDVTRTHARTHTPHNAHTTTHTHTHIVEHAVQQHSMPKQSSNAQLAVASRIANYTRRTMQTPLQTHRATTFRAETK